MTDVRLAEHVDVVIRDQPAAIESLVDDDRILVRLRVEIPLEVIVSLSRCVRHIDVRHAPVGRLGHSCGHNELDPPVSIEVEQGEPSSSAGPVSLRRRGAFVLFARSARQCKSRSATLR